jgi:hypothetical protein
MWESRRFLRDFQGRWKGWEAWVWLSMLSTGRHFHRITYSWLSSLLSSGALACVGNDYDSVPVSRMCARSVMRSSSALQSLAFGITCVHSENGKLVVRTTAVLSARSAIT